MREYVCIGSPDDVSDFRERWMVRAQAIARDLGLTFKVDYASDPFFGRVGQMKAVSQKQQSLKFELLIPLRSEEQPTACMSFNYHRDHFGTTWDIKDVDGRTGAYRLRGLRNGSSRGRHVPYPRHRSGEVARQRARAARPLRQQPRPGSRRQAWANSQYSFRARL